MNQFLNRYFLKFFDNSLELRVKLFNILAMAGICISIYSTIYNIVLGSFVMVSLSVIGILVAAILLIYSYRTGKYELCYIITIITVMFLLLPTFFLLSGGYKSGMPAFCVFSVIFTVLMLEKWWAVIVAALEVALYVGLSIFAYIHPEHIIHFNSEGEIVQDIIICYVLVCVSCGIAVYYHLLEYEKQKIMIAAQNEKLKVYDEMKSTFLTTVAHEIKNPLTAIKMYARDTTELLDEEPEEILIMEENLETIENVVLRVDQIVLDLMDTVSIEQGRLSLALAPTRLADVIIEACNTYSKGVNVSGNELVTDIEEDLPPLYADHARLLQVVTNILSNASRHTKNGMINVALFEDNGTQIISISDNGEGMDEKMKQNALKGYVSASKEYWRHGIGLYVSHQIVEAHGGEIWIESEPGKGTTVSFTVPNQTR